jgi:hypothetical protein
MQFINRTGSGLIAYGVGVGKTASAIMNLSYLLGSNQVNKPIVVVPNAVYDKWKLEMFGGEEIVYEVRYLDNNFETLSTFDKLLKAKKFAKEVKGEIFKKSLVVEGHIPQWNKYVELYNLSEDYVKKIKNYSEENLEQMAKAETLTEFLSDIPENYDFGDDEISAELSALYYGWNRLVFNVNWDNYIFDLLTKFKQKNNIPNYDTLTDEQYEEFQPDELGGRRMVSFLQSTFAQEGLRVNVYHASGPMAWAECPLQPFGNRLRARCTLSAFTAMRTVWKFSGAAMAQSGSLVSRQV